MCLAFLRGLADCEIQRQGKGKQPAPSLAHGRPQQQCRTVGPSRPLVLQGVEAALRAEAWPLLLEVYGQDSTEDERLATLAQLRKLVRERGSKWLRFSWVTG